MKKKLKKLLLISAVLTAAVLCTTCKQFLDDPEEYLKYWSTEVSGTGFDINKPVKTIGGVPCVRSSEDVRVTVKLKNPKNIRLVMPASSSDAKKIILFPGLSTQPVYGTDYTLKQTATDKLELMYKSVFLKKHEWGKDSIGAEITLIAEDGRKFKTKFNFNLKANTVPPKPVFKLAKTRSNPSYYVLCLTVPDMDKKAEAGLLHKDLTRIEVNGKPYIFSVNKEQTAFSKPEAGVFITKGGTEKLEDSDEVPSGGWVLYYKTDAEVKDGAAAKNYTVKLFDAGGLVSEALSASTKPNKAEAEDIRITKGTKIRGSGSESDPYIIGTDSAGAWLSISSATPNTTVHCTVSETGGSVPLRYDGNPVTVPLGLNGAGEKNYKLEYYTDGTGFAATAVKTVYYKVLSSTAYRVEHYQEKTDGIGQYPGSPYETDRLYGTTGAAISVTLKTYQGFVFDRQDPSSAAIAADGSTVVKVYYKRKTVNLTFNLSGGNVSGNTSDVTVSGRFGTAFTAPAPVKTGYTLSGWTPGLPSPQVFPAGDAAYTAQWTASGSTAYKVEHHQQNIDGTGYTIVSGDTENLTGATGAVIAAAHKNYPGFEFEKQEPSPAAIAADGSTVVKVYYKRKTVNLTFNLNGGNIGGSTSDVTVSGRFGTAFTAPVPVKTGYTLSGWTPGLPSPPVFPAGDAAYTVQWTANIYTVTFRVEGGQGGSLKGACGIQEETASGNDTKTLIVPHGGSVNFTAIHDTGWEVESWTVSSGSFASGGTAGAAAATLSGITEAKTVRVKFKIVPVTINGSSNNAWKTLKETVAAIPDGGTVIIDGEIKATNADGNNGEIVINKNLTVKGYNNNRDIHILNANKGDFGNASFRIFNVEASKKLTLKNLTLKNGKNVEGGGGDNDKGRGGGIYSEGDLEIENVLIENCESFIGGGGIYCSLKGPSSADLRTFIMKGSEVRACKTSLNSALGSSGGGVSVSGSNCLFKMKMTDVTIKNNEACSMGAGLLLSCGRDTVMTDDSLVLTRVILKENKLHDTNVYVMGAGILFSTFQNHPLTLIECTLTGNTSPMKGGGISTGVFSGQANAKIILKDCILTGNKASEGGGAYMHERSPLVLAGTTTFTPSTGNDANLKGKNDIFSERGQAITITESLSPQGGTAGRITLPDIYYKNGQKVLEAESGIDLAVQADLFDVTPQPTQKWTIDSQGTLQKTDYIRVPYTDLNNYLQTTASTTEVNYIKITDIDASQLTGNVTNPSPLGQKLKNHSGKKFALELPEKIDKLTNMEYCFQNCKNLVSIKNIPEGVTNLTGCFRGCNKLTEAPDIPASVTNIDSCFKGCKKLTAAPRIRENVTSMTYCFMNCEELTQVPVIPASVMNMVGCFYGCNKLTAVSIIPASVRVLLHCFEGCTSLTSVKLECAYNSDFIYGKPSFKDAFKDCTSLQNGEIKVPNGQLDTYKANATTMGTTAVKFSSW